MGSVRVCVVCALGRSNRVLNMLQCALTAVAAVPACRMDGAVTSSALGAAQGLNLKIAWHVAMLSLRTDA